MNTTRTYSTLVVRRNGVLHVEIPAANGWQTVETFPDTPQGKEQANEAAHRLAFAPVSPTPSASATAPAMNAQTPGPLAVMPCPVHHGKHPFHDHRWIVTAGTYAEFGRDPRSWDVSASGGTLIAEMRDGEPANARLLAAAYSAFDRAGRELGTDATTLAERLDLVAVIKAAVAQERAGRIGYAYTCADQTQRTPEGREADRLVQCDAADQLRAALAPLGELLLAATTAQNQPR